MIMTLRPNKTWIPFLILLTLDILIAILLVMLIKVHKGRPSLIREYYYMNGQLEYQTEYESKTPVN